MVRLGSNIRTIIKNSAYLMAVQGWGYLIPLLIIPLLISRLGMDGFGVIALLGAVVGVFKVFVNYGFDKTAVIDVSNNYTNKVRLSVIFSEIITSRVLLIIIGFPFYFLIVFIIPVTNEHLKVSIMMYVIVLSEGLIPQWFYQGISDLKYISLARVFQKTMYGILIFFIVLSPDDLYIIPLIDGITLFLVSLFFLIKSIIHYEIDFKLSSINAVINQLKRSFDVFYSNLLSIIQLSINTIVLGVVSGNEIVAVYSIAEKIYTAIRGLFIPINQAILPRAAIAYSHDKPRYNQMLKISMKIYLIISILGFFGIYIYGIDVINLLSKNSVYNNQIEEVLSIISLAMPTSIIGILSMKLIISGKRKEIIKIATIATLLNILFIYPLVFFYQHNGAALCFILVQFYILTSQALENRKLQCLKG